MIKLHSLARRPFMITLRRMTRTVVNLVKFPYAVIHYKRYRQTEIWAHQALVQLFCATGGRFNDLLSSLIRLSSRPLALPPPGRSAGRPARVGAGATHQNPTRERLHSIPKGSVRRCMRPVDALRSRDTGFGPSHGSRTGRPTAPPCTF